MSHKHYGIDAEPDVSGKINRNIWLYFIVLGILLFAMIGGLNIFYLFQVDHEKQKKIGKINTRESMDKMALSQSYLSGKRGLFEDKQHMAVSEAMDMVLKNLREKK
jgi:hypothetical protein